jgi:ankyrin repeat protein
MEWVVGSGCCLILGIVVALVVIVGGAFLALRWFWRLADQPTTLDLLKKAIEAGDEDKIRETTEQLRSSTRGIDAPSDEQPPLADAISEGNERLFDILLDLGASPNTMTAPSSYDMGMPLIHHAMMEGNDRIVQQLLACGADPNRRDKWKGRTALHQLCVTGIPADRAARYAALLMKHGANPQARDEEGRTALVALAENGRPGALYEVVRTGTDTTDLDQFDPEWRQWMTEQGYAL